MANTYVAIATTTVGSGGAANIEFTSIPGTYTDLQVVLSGRTNRSDAANDDYYVSFNNSTTNYSNVYIRGSGSAIVGAKNTTWAGIYGVTNGNTATTSAFSISQIYIPNYTSSYYKSVLSFSAEETNASTSYMFMLAGLWSNTAAITSIKITPDNSFRQHTTATLYGIKNS